MTDEITSWKEQAEALFFVEHLSLIDICKIVKKSRKHITLSLQASMNFDYEKERQWRKEQNAAKRKAYKREWDRNNRPYEVTAESMRQEHEQAVKILSHEKYY